MKVNEYFSDFIKNISLSNDLVQSLKSAHTDLRTKLSKDESTKDLVVATFIQGSYARSTCIKPADDNKVDVDVIAVTNIPSSTSARSAFESFYPFMKKNYSVVSEDDDAKVRQQSRSIGIALQKVDLDFVPTSAPSEEVNGLLRSIAGFSDFTVDSLVPKSSVTRFYDSLSAEGSNWKDEPLNIPDYDTNTWDKTHPLQQIQSTHEKNKLCNGYFLRVVKCIKWWKRVNLSGQEHPKSYPLERFVGECCPNDIHSVGEGIVLTFEKIVNDYKNKPFLPDYGVPMHDVFGRLSDKDYKTFYEKVKQMAPLAREAYDSNSSEVSVNKWREFFAECSEFPEYSGPSSNAESASFTPRQQKSVSFPTSRFG